MPFFQRKTAEEKQAEEERRRQSEAAAQEQQRSLQVLEAGGIPLQAQARLEDFRRQGGKFFTSDLSVNEFALSRQAGFRPLSQVMGSSVYHVGWQRMPGSSMRSFRSQELSAVSQAMNHARMLALGRLEQEARLAGGDAVVGVHITRAGYDWGKDLVEFNAVGTAVRLGDKPSVEHPALTNLSGQDFWKLHQSGYWPLGVVGASTVYYVVASWRTQSATNSWWGSWANQELEDFTAGLYAARHIAMSQIHEQVARMHGHGIIGMVIEQEEEEHEVDIGNDQERTDMIFTFHGIGTAIADAPAPRAPMRTYTALKLND